MLYMFHMFQTLTLSTSFSYLSRTVEELGRGGEELHLRFDDDVRLSPRATQMNLARIQFFLTHNRQNLARLKPYYSHPNGEFLGDSWQWLT